MKASDSSNSLTQLNPNNECFVCLEDGEEGREPLVDSSIVRTCGCRFYVHPACWNLWIKGKSDFDCPICRRESLHRLHINIPPNPVDLHVDMNEMHDVRYSKKLLLMIGCAILSLAATFIGALTTNH